jgi:Fe/S biogenesis protein NfuA
MSVMSTEDLLKISEEALERIIEIRDEESAVELFGLLIEITSLNGAQFGYSLSFVPLGQKRDTDHSEMHGDLTVMIPEKDVDNMRGATLAISSNPATPGLAIDNPNGPSPTMSAPPPGDLTGPIAERVTQVLEQQVNPAIASHGGQATLVSEENGVVYLRLGGGCQGCGMAAVTLSQGIEKILFEAIPDIVEIVDVTDHQSGENPYYESSKK